MLEEGDEDEDVEEDDLSLAQAISLYQHMREREEMTTSHQHAVAGPSSARLLGSVSGSSETAPLAEAFMQAQRSTLKQDSYFSDEDASDND